MQRYEFFQQYSQNIVCFTKNLRIFALSTNQLLFVIMKKFLPLLLALLAVFPLGAAEYRLTVDNIDNVDLDVNGTLVTPVADGDMYKIDMGSEMYLRVIAKPGVLFTSVTIEDTYFDETRDMAYAISIRDDGRYYVDLNSSFPEDEIFHITTSGATDARTASCTVNIDDPSRAKLTRGGEIVDLTAGANTLKFDPANESVIEIEPVGKPLYKVTHGDVEVMTEYRYVITVTDGDVINIQANYPDMDCTVAFFIDGYGAEDFITGVDVDGRPVFNWKDDGFTVKCGSEFSIYGNLNEYEVLNFMVNGETQIFTSKTNLLIVENTAIAATVQKYAVFPLTINVDNPANVRIYRGHSQNGEEFTNLTAGDNQVEITRNTPIVSIIPADGYYVKTLKVNDDVYDVEDIQVSPIRIGQLIDNDVITLTTAAYVRDQKATIILKNLADAEGYFVAKRADLSIIEGLHEGENELLFDPRDNRFRFETGGPVEAHVRLNGELIEPEPGGYNYCPTLVNGDNLMITFGDEEFVSIDEISALSGSEVLYDLCGRRVTNPTRRGIYITPTRKIIF